MDDAARVDDVERLIRERQRLRADGGTSLEPAQLKALRGARCPAARSTAVTFAPPSAYRARSVPRPEPISSTFSPACFENSITSGIHGA